MFLLRYFSSLSSSRLILWAYVIWWVVMVNYYFLPEPRIWATSLGVGVIVGFALMLSTGPISLERFRLRFWESLRLFICPFLVSSFSALVAGNSFILVFSPRWEENATAVASIAVFLLLARLMNMTALRGEQ